MGQHKPRAQYPPHHRVEHLKGSFQRRVLQMSQTFYLKKLQVLHRLGRFDHSLTTQKNPIK